MHDNPRATETEQEEAQKGTRQQEEEAMRGPEHHEPDEQRRGAGTGDEEG